MTIEEARAIIKEEKEGIFMGIQRINNAKLVIRGYEQAKAEHEGATVIPKGWKLDDVSTLFDMNGDQYEYTVMITSGDESFIGKGEYIHEALRNALKQIEELKG